MPYDKQLLIPRILDRGLGGGEACDRHPEGGAGHIGEPHVVAELHGRGIAALLTADAQLDIGTGLAAQLTGHLDQTAHAHLIQAGEGIGLIDLPVIVAGQEKNSASLAMSSAVRAARGISIMVPTL